MGRSTRRPAPPPGLPKDGAPQVLGGGPPGIECTRHQLAERIVDNMVAHAAYIGSFVLIDMEGAEYTEPTLALTERLHHRYPGAVGTVLQAYLFRTENDAERLLSQGIRIRLWKS